MFIGHQSPTWTSKRWSSSGFHQRVDLRDAVEQFTADCKAAGMRGSTPSLRPRALPGSGGLGPEWLPKLKD